MNPRGKKFIKRQNRHPLQGRDFYVASVIGKDQVGIVSEVTRLYERSALLPGDFGSGPEKESSGIME